MVYIDDTYGLALKAPSFMCLANFEYAPLNHNIN